MRIIIVRLLGVDIRAISSLNLQLLYKATSTILEEKVINLLKNLEC